MMSTTTEKKSEDATATVTSTRRILSSVENINAELKQHVNLVNDTLSEIKETLLQCVVFPSFALQDYPQEEYKEVDVNDAAAVTKAKKKIRLLKARDLALKDHLEDILKDLEHKLLNSNKTLKGATPWLGDKELIAGFLQPYHPYPDPRPTHKQTEARQGPPESGSLAELKRNRLK